YRRSQEHRSPAIGVALARNRLPQNFPRGLRAVELTQRAAFDLPALRRAHEFPTVRRHAMDAEALGVAVVGDVDGIALRLRHQDLQIGRDDRGVALDRDMGQGGEMRKPALDRGLVVGTEHLIGDAVARAGWKDSRRSRTCRLPPTSPRYGRCRRCRRWAGGWRSGCRSRADLRW